MGSSKATLALTVFVVLVGVMMSVSLLVEGARNLHDDHEANKKPTEDEVQHPENFFGGLGGIFPSPSTGSSVPTIPGFGSSTGTPPGVAGSPVNFCSLPGVGCVSVQPANPGSTGSGTSSGGLGGSSTPNYPFP